VLEKPDLARWRRTRPDLVSRDYIRRSNGTVLLRLAKGACVHLGDGNRCAIYPLRPGNCSEFPVGAEPCLAARLETLGVVD
jgi:Fe-S-cluster containining protein